MANSDIATSDSWVIEQENYFTKQGHYRRSPFALSSAVWRSPVAPSGHWRVKATGTCAACQGTIQFSVDVPNLATFFEFSQCDVFGSRVPCPHCRGCTMEASLSHHPQVVGNRYRLFVLFSGVQGAGFSKPRLQIESILPVADIRPPGGECCSRGRKGEAEKGS